MFLQTEREDDLTRISLGCLLYAVMDENLINVFTVAQWLAFATRDRKVASLIPDRGIPGNNLG